ncbi:hypothetical protein JZ751_015790 [Albula glossodonta]|uniref:Uncharacterized protein n=1 Tax=Albula glossodonta TaxID=121402 RepID=A0A8T2MMA4_9TELE|nr:hypothetical protein JZ751_015790 [Albula glossodonta]
MQLDPHPRLHLQEVHVEVHPHRLVDGVQEQVLCVAFQQRGFSHRGVPKHDNPELVLPQGQLDRLTGALGGWGSQDPERRESRNQGNDQEVPPRETPETCSSATCPLEQTSPW